MSFEINLIEIGRRIEELRGRLSQSDFSGKIGVDRKTVGTWERGERLPDTKALLALWSEFDADPAWVLTGKGFEPSGNEDERELIALFRAAPLAVKAAAIGALQGGSSKAQKSQKQTSISIGENHGQVVKGGQVNYGPLNFGNPGKTK